MRAINDIPLDLLLAWIRDNCDKMTFCAGQPATFGEANTAPTSGGKALVAHAMVLGDFALADGADGGRALTIAEQTDTVDESGTGDHVALIDTSASRLLYIATASPQAVTAGRAFLFPEWLITVTDPQPGV